MRLKRVYQRVLAVVMCSASLSVWLVPAVFADQTVLTQEILPMYCESQLVIDGTRTEIQITPGCEQIVRDAQMAAASTVPPVFPVHLVTSEDSKIQFTSFFQKEVQCDAVGRCVDIAISKIDKSGILTYL